MTTPFGTSPAVQADRFTYTEQADLAVALTAAPVTGLLGGKVNYTVTITNRGPSALVSGTVSVPLTAPTTATSTDCTSAAGKITCTLPALANGASTTRHFSVPVGLLTYRTFTVTATRTASLPVDPASANDTASRTCKASSSLNITCS